MRMRTTGGRPKIQTDWTAYYKKKKSFLSDYTQQFTLKKIIGVIDCYSAKDVKNGLNILELGGGRSCFAKQLCQKRNIDTYDIADNNRLAVNLFRKMIVNSRHHSGIQLNLLEKDADEKFHNKYDFVFSVGLIEHFRGKDIETVIRRHFDYCKPEGTVMITFPTPTRKYRMVRRCMEVLGVWQFYDEMPIRYGEVKEIFERYGIVMDCFINRKLPLTQMVVITRNIRRGECDVSQD